MDRQPFRAYFEFTKRERTGILVLLLLTGSCIGLPLAWEAYAPVKVETDSVFLADVAAFRQQLAKAKAAESASFTARRYRAGKARPERAGGYQLPFYRDSVPRHREYPAYKRTWHARKPVIVDINQADSAAWEALPGIGPVLAARIVRFREKLGGFHAIAQIAETYGLPDSTFKKIQPSLRLGSVSLKKLDINEMDEQSLAKHPYIRYKLARLIVKYRSVHGPFSRPEQLQNIPLVDDSIYRKLEKYISF
ncbi:ComEA family DNA-binding protein [Chitinophaga japonensis]|uniref:DNA uptake protein ComE-like DNA-binding protein n=1 Tax=Chitinophaga japonensis TaxID=104662 RepID=A0A562TFM7_CHIJA|nr:helix-hairpin-helix domain-containing protein [Chitinophaga japonensis]TWI92305.1 DNA uptake protein ComE-like DNA-binding protein [Chitinophaga japonensis]